MSSSQGSQPTYLRWTIQVVLALLGVVVSLLVVSQSPASAHPSIAALPIGTTGNQAYDPPANSAQPTHRDKSSGAIAPSSLLTPNVGEGEKPVSISTSAIAAKTVEGGVARATSKAAANATAHGSERLAQAGFTDEVVAATKNGMMTRQADGATVFIREPVAGKYDFIIEGENGVVTAHRGWSFKSVTRLANNYGWEGWPP